MRQRIVIAVNLVGERMAHKGRLHVVFGIKTLLKREQHQNPVDRTPDLVNAPCAPGPDLWTHIVNGRDTCTPQLFFHSEIEARRIHADENIRRIDKEVCDELCAQTAQLKITA